MSEREYLQLLGQIIEDIFCEWTDSVEELARKSRLCPATIHRLRSIRTKRPQLRTIVLLAKAVGIKLVLDFRNKKVLGRAA